MRDLCVPYQQHRQAVGNHLCRQDARQESRRSQNQRVQDLAGQPGLHAANRHRQSAARACLALLSMLSAVRGSTVHFATTPARVEQRRLENRIAQADASYGRQAAEKANRPEFGRKGGRTAPVQPQTSARKPSALSGKPSCRAGTGAQISTPCHAGAPLPTVAATVPALTGNSVSDVGDVCARARAGAGELTHSAGTHTGNVRSTSWFASAAPVGSTAPAPIPDRLNVVLLDAHAAHTVLAALVGGDDGRFMADEISRVSAGNALMLTPVSSSRISKRAALADLAARDSAVYNDYLRNNCHIRSKTVSGHPIGDGLLVAGEYVRNPWRGMAEALKGVVWPGREVTSNEELATEIFNVASDIGLAFITVGAYPIIKYGVAKSLSVGGQAVNGDTTCLKREFSPEEMARLLFDTETGITHHQPLPTLQRKSADIAGAARFTPSGLFVEQRLPSGVHTEKFMAINKEGVDILIREKADGIFVTYDPLAVHPEQQVFFDAQSQRVFFDKRFSHGSGFDANVVEGRRFIEIQGEPFELLVHAGAPHLEIQVQQAGVTRRLPVYMEKLSHRWHLGVHNNHPVFADWQVALIDRFKLAADNGQVYQAVDNLNPTAYGKGKIHEVRRSGASPYEPADLSVIEMHGELVPVRARTVEGHGVRYEAYNPTAAEKNGRPVEWDGLRWLFEKHTSVHVTPSLKKAVDASMFDRSVSAGELSAPDQRGIRWDAHDRAYLKISGGFVRIRRYGYHPDAWYLAHAGKKTNLFFHNNRFHQETYRHRLQRVLTRGMSGKGTGQAPKRPASAGERTAMEVVQEFFRYTPEQARTYLRQFHFQTNGRFSEREFAMQMERYHAEPQWPRRMSPAANAPVPEAAGAQPPSGNRIALGTQLSEGTEGIVYRDANDDAFVIKKLKDALYPGADGSSGSSVDDMTALALRLSADQQVAIFNRYYGDGMAETVVEGNHMYVRMPRVPGKELTALDKGDMPEDGVERFVDMLEKLADVGIWHGDLHERNVFFDTTDNMFYPIDFSNYEQRFRTAGPETRKNLIVRGEYLWNRAVEIIRSKQADPAQGPP